MAEKKMPFKSNVPRPPENAPGQPPTDAERRHEFYKSLKAWGKSRKQIKSTEVNTREERIELIKWLAKWAIIIPLGAYAVSWIIIMFANLFAV